MNAVVRRVLSISIANVRRFHSVVRRTDTYVLTDRTGHSAGHFFTSEILVISRNKRIYWTNTTSVSLYRACRHKESLTIAWHFCCNYYKRLTRSRERVARSLLKSIILDYTTLHNDILWGCRPRIRNMASIAGHFTIYQMKWFAIGEMTLKITQGHRRCHYSTTSYLPSVVAVFVPRVSLPKYYSEIFIKNWNIFNLSPTGLTLEFYQDLWCDKTSVFILAFGVDCFNL